MTAAEADRLIIEFAELVGANRILIIGSQAIHAFYRDPPIDLVAGSREVDVIPLPYAAFDKWFYYAHERLGADSEFDIENGVYVDMVRDTTPKLPSGWEQRAVERTLRAKQGRSVVAVYPDVHDLLATKLLLGRPQDVGFVKGVLRLLEIDRATVAARIGEIMLPTEREPARAEALRLLPRL